jgi:hypothetical protein
VLRRVAGREATVKPVAHYEPQPDHALKPALPVRLGEVQIHTEYTATRGPVRLFHRDASPGEYGAVCFLRYRPPGHCGSGMAKDG